MPDPAWFRDVAAGDVLLTRSGDLRLIRTVHHMPRRDRQRYRFTVTLAIRRCSWTGRPSTVYLNTDRYLKDCQRVARGVPVDRSMMDRALLRAIGSKERPALRCDMVRGMP